MIPKDYLGGYLESLPKECKDTFKDLLKAMGYNHNPTSQKGCWTTKRKNQILINIYVFPFKAMVIMENYYFFIQMNVKEFKPKIHLIKF